MKEPIIDIINLSLCLAQKTILRSISFSISDGECVSIIGPNGAGKTSLLKCLLRIFPNYKGTICLNSTPIENLKQKELARRISYVPQSSDRIFPYTVKEFVMMGRYPYLSPFTSMRIEDRQAVDQALELTNSTTFADRHLDTLSGGERQIIFIAAALAQGAKIILLDEPTTFLDPKHAGEIYLILKTLNQEMGITIITVTHDINSAALNSSRTVILKEGSILFDGNSQEMMHNHILEPAFDRSFIFLKHPVTGQQIIAPEVV